MRKRIDLSEFHFDWGDDDTEQTPPIEVRHVKTFKSEIDSIISICPASDCTTWVAGHCDDVIILYQSDGREIKRLKTDIFIDDMKITKMGNLLLSPSLGTNVKFVYGNSGDTQDFADLAPYKTRGLFITEDQEVLVSIRNDVNTAKVVMLSTTGEKKRELTYHRSGSNLFSDPDRLVRNTVGDIIVLDWNKRKILSVDNLGRYKYVYDGKPKGCKCDNDFVPSDIVCDKYDNVLVSDYENNKVHMLNRNGEFLRYLITDENGLSRPCAMALDDTGQLWIGQLNGQIHVVRYYSS